MENTPKELETKTSSKDLWLFLIVLDVIFLCVFGFFLYKHFTAEVMNPSAAAPAQVVKTQDELPAIEGEEIVVTEETVVEVTAPAPAKPAEKAKAPLVEKPQAKPQPAASPAATKTAPVAVPAPAEPAQTPAQAQVQSIYVAPAAANSKYRRVTFKWFGPAETVSIVSGFTNRKPQALKKVGDHWETTLTIAPGTYKFLYIVNGKNTPDPYAELKDGRSVLVVK